jgi:pyruvate-formate lyase-activating enzyme
VKVFDPMPANKTLSLMPTFRCTAACTHCGTLSSPANKTTLSHDVLEDAIRQAAGNGYGVVVFTGGEPTLIGPRLESAIRLAKSLGLLTRIVTNGWWARTPIRAKKKIAELIDAGLDEINFSTGDQHVRFVPLRVVVQGIRAAVEGGLGVAVMIECTMQRVVTKQSIEAHPEMRALVSDRPNAQIIIHESPWMPLDPNEIQEYPKGVAINRFNLASRQGCDSVLGTTTVEADGTIGACCGIGMRLVPELQMGNIANTSLAEAARRAEMDFLKRWVRIEGPERILQWASSYDPSIQWENLYAHRCQACIRMYQDPRVRRVITEHHLEKLPDVVFGEWLLFQYSGVKPEALSAATGG